MPEIKFLEKNPNTLADILSVALDSNELTKIVDLRNKHVKLLMKLGNNHLCFAKSISSRSHWRQKVSRSYYACYNVSKALRLANSGAYSQEGQDHKKIGELPSDFPERSFWKDLFVKFRKDRNVCDYDHTARANRLEYKASFYIEKSQEFYRTSKDYLKEKSGILL